MEQAPKPLEREPSESFGIEFGNEKNVEIKSAMTALGFRFDRGEWNEDQTRYTVIGARSNGDGTTVTMTFEKGANYRSPREIADAEAAAKENQ